MSEVQTRHDDIKRIQRTIFVSLINTSFFFSNFSNFEKKKKKKKKGRSMVYIELANFYRKIFESCCSSLFAKGKERYSLLLSDPT
jgi:hypothetical protein